MALVVRDGNNASQNLPNTGVDATVYRIFDSTITASATSATDIYQFKGAAAVVARLRRLKFYSGTIAGGAITTLAGSSTFMKLTRRTAAGTVGTWTQLNTSTTYAQASAYTAAGVARAASGITVNVAGNTAFTVGATAGDLDFGYLAVFWIATPTINAPVPSLEWTYGAGGAYPVDVVGTSDYVCVNLNGVTPIQTIRAVLEWEEATA